MIASKAAIILFSSSFKSSQFFMQTIRKLHSRRVMCRGRGGACPRKIGRKRDGIDGQQVYLTVFITFFLWNENRPEESGVDMSTPVHPMAPPL